MSDRVAVFNRGGIEQIGSPRELYECPASEFVARFVGTSTILTRGGQRLMLRPEKVQIARERETFAGDGWHAEPGRLSESVYAGAFTKHIVTLEGGETVIAFEQNSSHFSRAPVARRGEPVWAAWRPSEVFVLTG